MLPASPHYDCRAAQSERPETPQPIWAPTQPMVANSHLPSVELVQQDRQRAEG